MHVGRPTVAVFGRFMAGMLQHSLNRLGYTYGHLGRHFFAGGRRFYCRFGIHCVVELYGC